MPHINRLSGEVLTSILYLLGFFCTPQVDVRIIDQSRMDEYSFTIAAYLQHTMQ